MENTEQKQFQQLEQSAREQADLHLQQQHSGGMKQAQDAADTTPEDNTPKKWTTDGKIGPRIVKRLNGLISKIQWEGSCIRELSGVIGVSERASCLWIPICGPGMTEYSRRALCKVGAAVNWIITEKNYKQLELDLTAVLKDISRPEVYHQKDTRITPEQDAQNRRERAEREAQQQKEAQEEKERLHAAGQLTDHEKSSYSIKQIAEIVRAELKQKQPGNVYSVTIEKYSMGQSLHIALMEAPFEAIDRAAVIAAYKKQEIEYHHASPDITEAEILEKHGADIERATKYLQCGHVYGEYKDGICNGPTQRLTREAWEALREASEIAGRYNWDHSDIQTDYFDVHFYMHLYIGGGHTNNKPFTVRAYTPETTAAEAVGASTATGTTGGQVRRNTAKNGVEVVFPGKPTPEIIADLKAAGFRWSFKSRVWYTRYSEEAEVQARRIIGAA